MSKEKKEFFRGHYASLLNLLDTYRNSEDPQYPTYTTSWRYMLKRNIDFIRKELFSGEKGNSYADTINKFYEYRVKKSEISGKYQEEIKDSEGNVTGVTISNQEEFTKEIEALDVEFKSVLDKYNKDMNEPITLSKPLYAVLPENAPQFSEQDVVDFLIDLGVIRDDI